MITVDETSDEITVRSPFHPLLPKKARLIAGDWDGNVWTFDRREEAKVLKLYKDVFGYEKGGKTVDIRVTLAEGGYLSAGTTGLMLAGRQIGRATGRDTGAKVGEGIIFETGEVTSGGSAKNWTTRTTDGCVFIIRDLYEHAFLNIKKMHGWDDEISNVELISENQRSNEEIDQEISELKKIITKLENSKNQ